VYTILLTPTAARFLAKSDEQLRQRIVRCLEQIATTPKRHPNIKRLTGRFAGDYRYRLGDYRIVYEVHESGKLVVVLIIAHRRQVYE
jgi:mRNA interferase RelE/StbE